MAAYAGITDALAAAGVGLSAVSTASPEESRAYAEREHIPFTLFCDPSRRAATAWDRLNRFTSLAEPAVVVMDAEGVVRLMAPEVDGIWMPPAALLALVTAGVDAGLERRWRRTAAPVEGGGWLERLIRRFRRR